MLPWPANSPHMNVIFLLCTWSWRQDAVIQQIQKHKLEVMDKETLKAVIVMALSRTPVWLDGL